MLLKSAIERTRTKLFLAGALALTSCQHPTAPGRAALPFGSVDTPSSKAVVEGTLPVAGWALAEQPIQAVSVYVDRQFVANAALKLARPDVAGAKPGYHDAANSGWMATLDTTSLAPGWHELVVQARSRDGATRDLATVPISVKR